MHISYYMISEKGDRSANEDAVGVSIGPTEGMFVLADGLGGHGHGDMASQYAVKEMLRIYEQYGLKYSKDTEQFFRTALDHIQAGLQRQKEKRGFRGSMGATFAAALVAKTTIGLAHVGDARIYLLGKGKILHRTLDHSVPQVLALAGEIQESQIRRHPDRNRLLRALGGATETCAPDTASCSSQDVNAILLCSDGFWEYVEERVMVSMLRTSRTPQEWVKQMAAHIQNSESESGDSKDNYSAIGVFIEE